MIGSQFAWRGAALALGCWTLATAVPVAALELELPGERKFEVHGFYEFRLRGFGRNYPSGGLTSGISLTQFRHVLNIETEMDIFPEGAGPIDFLMMYTRWVVSYECVYRRACGLFDSADSFGGRHREPNRLPRNFNPAKTELPYTAGVLERRFFPGTLLSTNRQRQHGTGDKGTASFVGGRTFAVESGDSRRWRRCLNPDGVFWNPWPFSGFCNNFTRTVLDQPIDQFLPIQARTRAGAVNPGIAKQLLNAARAGLDRRIPGRFEELAVLPVLDQKETSSVLLSSSEGFTSGLARAIQADGARSGLSQAEIAARLDALTRDRLGDPELTFADTLNGQFEVLLNERPDPDRLRPLSLSNGVDLNAALYGATEFDDATVTWLTDMDLPIRPLGYFKGQLLDSVNELGIGVAADFGRSSDPLLGSLVDVPQVRTRTVPRFFGPDGAENTADDLPIVRCPGGTVPVEGAGGRCALPDGTQDSTDPGLEPLYYIAFSGSGESAQLAVGLDPSSEADVRFCKGLLPEPSKGGINMNGECIVASTSARFDPSTGTLKGDSPTIAALALLQDPANRPGTARIETANLTDLRLRAGGGGLPARPIVRELGLFYPSAGLERTTRRVENLVSSLELDFTEDNLAWEHGASQDEHEFREGYLELEFLDSQVFMRLGKLVMVWGKTELFRNQDRLNPTDSGFGTLSRLEESRVGQWAIQTIVSPEFAMSVGPFEDLRLELAVIFDDFEYVDLGECGESLVFSLACGIPIGAQASGLVGVGLVGVEDPYDNESGATRWDFGARIEGRMNRFTFSLSEFYGWDDGFLLKPIFQYGRRVDPVTGAPVNSVGPLQCSIRRVDGVAVGPNGVAGDADDAIPSVGNCLLYAPSGETNEAGVATDTLRSPEAIALGHYANQTLFHFVCALSFQGDSGQCAVDSLNNASLFGAISNVLSGQRGLGGLAADGFRSVRLKPSTDSPFDQQRFQETRSGFEDGLFAQVPLTTEQAFSTSMTVEQRALLGCGPAFATACDQTAVNQADDSFRDAAGIDTSLGEVLLGGIDLLNADASVILQDFEILKALQPGALVGTRGSSGGGLRFEAGITSGGLTANEVMGLRAAGEDPTAIARQRLADELELTLDDPETATDLEIEGMKWLIATPDVCEQFTGEFKEDCLKQAEGHEAGFLRFVDPRGPNGVWDGGSGDDVFNPLGENCTPVHGGLDAGCTPLEVVSANLERFLIANEIVGPDQVFDPPETFAELLAVLDGNPATDRFGDPVAGVDGIRFLDFDLDPDFQFDPENPNAPTGDGVLEDGRLDVDQKAKVLDSGQFVADDFDGCLTAGSTTDFCFLNLDRSNPIGPTPPAATSTGLVAALPLGMRLSVECAAPPCDFLTLGEPGVSGQPGEFLTNKMLQIQKLTPLQLQQLVEVDYQELTVGQFFSSEGVAVDAATIGLGPEGTTLIIRPVVKDQRRRLITKISNPNGRIIDSNGRRLLLVDIDNDGSGTPDLDEDQDDTFDFVDDGTAGPITDDNILCGSGIPGDPLQDAQQFELDGAEMAQLSESGISIPERSPVFCAGLTGLLNASGETLPFVRAGGDGGFGRRDFLWHGGRQLKFDFQRKNVLGVGLDFAWDRTKSSWGIELTWTKGKLYSNSLEYDSLTRSDEFVLSVAMDRPTFFNFLNPNRSFFITIQAFFRYIPNFKGGADDRDGMFGAQEHAFSPGFLLVNFSTGYFQDRLSPTVSSVYDWGTGTAGILSSVNYKWNDSFSTRFSLNHFFGHHTEAQAAMFPSFLLTNPDTTSEIFRGLSAVRNRDVAALTIRYTF